MRRTTVGLLATALAACSVEPRARDMTAPGWTSCTVAELPGTVRKIRCGSAELRVMRAQTLAGPHGVDYLADTLPGNPKSRRESVRVGDRDVPMRVGERHVVAAPQPNVLAYCLAERAEDLWRCRAAIVSIARDGLPDGVEFPAPRLELLGRAIVIPPDCSLEGAERIVCRRGVIDWREQESTADAGSTLAGYSDVLRASLGQVTERREPCTLVGQTGVGAHYRVTTPRGVLYALACVVVRNGIASAAMCVGPEPPAPPYPAPCDQVFEATPMR